MLELPRLPYLNGLAPFPFNGPYNVSKFAVIAMTETLRAEVARFGIGVTVICPGLINTNISKDGRCRCDNQKTMSFLESFKDNMEKRGSSPYKVAKTIPKAIIKNRALVKISFNVVLIDFIRRLLP